MQNNVHLILIMIPALILTSKRAC